MLTQPGMDMQHPTKVINYHAVLKASLVGWTLFVEQTETYPGFFIQVKKKIFKSKVDPE